MPQVSKRRRVVNPARAKKKRRHNMTAKQIKFFGTKRQKAALKARRHNTSMRKVARKHHRTARERGLTKGIERPIIQLDRMAARMKSSIRKSYKKYRKAKGRKSNIGEILTLSLPGNPGRVKRTKRSNTNMAKARKRRSRRHNAHYVRRIKRGSYLYSNPARRHRRRRHNPRVVVRYRARKRHNIGRHRRRNPAFMTGTVGQIVGILGGATVTKLITDRLPMGLNSGFAGYLSTAVVAMVQGKVLGKVFKSPNLGNNMVIGGFTYLALRLVQDFVPSIGLPFGLRGMGVITPSSFYVPQVNAPGSMANFIPPAGIPVNTGGKGMAGLPNRRIGRMQ